MWEIEFTCLLNSCSHLIRGIQVLVAIGIQRFSLHREARRGLSLRLEEEDPLIASTSSKSD